MASQPSKTASSNGLARQPTWFTRRRLLLLTLAVFLFGGVAAALDIRFIGDKAPRAVLPSSLLVLDARTLETVRNVAGGRLPPHPGLVRGGGLVWTVDADTNKLIGRAPLSRRVVRTVTVGTGPVAAAVGFGSVWVANAENGSITRVALAGSKVETLGLNDQPSAITTGGGYVWILSERSKKVLRIDPETNLVTKKARFSNPPLAVVVRARRVYIAVGD